MYYPFYIKYFNNKINIFNNNILKLCLKKKLKRMLM